jgi:predicted Zn-dependent protease
MSFLSASPPCSTSSAVESRHLAHAQVGSRRNGAAVVALIAARLLLAASLADAADTPSGATLPSTPSRLTFIESLYNEHEDFRAESEVLAFLHEAPNSPLRPAVELVRAKLYYRARRYADADLMLLSLLDRTPSGPIAQDARTMLGFSWMRQGRLAEAEPLLSREPALDPLRQLPPYNAGRAVAWSTALPGSGFFVLDEPGRATTALALNAVFLAGTVLSYEQHNVPAALLFLLVEIAFYSGGRDAVREEAERLNERADRERRDAWFGQSSEPALMATAFRWKF